MGLRDHAMNSNFFLYTDHYRKGTASEESEDREDKCGNNWKNNSQENKDNEVTVETEDKKGGRTYPHALEHALDFVGRNNLGWGQKMRLGVHNTNLITHTQLHIYVVFIMLSIARSVAVSGSAHR